ncbi:MAG: YbgF trimerization domain-containing protein [Hellea sp.]|nr:YbgF trimerization domain-containing protein [Hellea sp.]
MLRAILLYLSILPILLANPSYAVSKKELAAKDLQLEERLSQLESRFLTGDPAAEQLIKRNYALEVTVRSLRGEVEQLMYELGQSNKKIDALYGDIDINLQRIIRLEHQLEELNSAFENSENSFISGNAPLGTSPGGDPFENTNNEDNSEKLDRNTDETLSQIPSAPVFKEKTIDVQAAYSDLLKLPEKGKVKLREGDYLGAQLDFEKYILERPDADDIAIVNYWLGESYFVRNGFQKAANAYIASLSIDPRGIKASSSMIKLATSFAKLNNPESCKIFNAFETQYPNATELEKAKANKEAKKVGC